MDRRTLPALLVAFVVTGVTLIEAARAQEVEAQVHTLANGMKFLFVPREGDPNVAAGWVARVGSVDERPGVTGVAHLFEHMMFKGTRVIGTSDIDQDLTIIAKLDAVRERIRKHEQALIEEHRRGRIDDPKNPENSSEQHSALITEFEELLERQREFVVKDELSRVYKTAGGSGLTAISASTRLDSARADSSRC